MSLSVVNPYTHVIVSGSTMAGPVRVSAPIENALGDYALVPGRVSGLGLACCHVTAGLFASL